jgi:hypothetical protein
LHNGFLFDIGQSVTSVQPFDSWMDGRVSYSGSLIAIEMQGVWVSASSAFHFNVNAVPIPATAWLFGSSLLGLGAVSRKRKAA